MKDEDKTKEQLINELVDLRERVAALEEEALRESEERYRTVVEDMPALVCRFLPDGVLTFVNEAYCRYFNKRREELEGQNFFQFIPEEEQEKVQRHYSSLTLEKPVTTYEHQVLAPDGTLRWQRWTDRALFDKQGRPMEYQSIGTDITDRKRTEEALRERTVQLTRSNALIAALDQVAARLQTSLDPNQVMETLGAELKHLSLNCIVALLEPDSQTAVICYISTESSVLTRIEKLTGLKLQGLRIPRLPIYDELVEQGHVVFVPSLVELASAALPGLPRPALKRALRLGGAHPDTPAFYIPLAIEDRVFGILNMVGDDLQEDDLPAVSVFASQVAIALENARLFEAEREQRELAEALEEAAITVSSTLDLNEVLDQILEQAERIVAGDAFSIILIEDDVAHLARWRGYELPEEKAQPSRFDIPMTKYSNLMKMVRPGKPVIVPDTALDPDWVPAVRDRGGWRRSYAGVPIRLGGATVGFLGVSGTRPGQLRPQDARRMEALASHAATAIENARLYEGIQQKAEELALLLDTATTVSSTLELDLILHTLAEKMTTSVGATFCRIALLDEMNQTLIIRAAFAARNLDWDPGLGRQYALADAPWHRQVIERCQIMILRQDDPSKAASETECRVALSEGIHSALLMPLVIRDRTLGMVSLGEMRGWERVPFTAERVRLCQAMANEAAVAIQNAQLLDAVTTRERDLERLSAQLINAQEEERKRISQELHDELGQALTAISFELAAIEKELPPELAPKIRERLAEATSLAAQVDEQVSKMALDLRPYMLDDLGLVSTLRWYVNRYAKRLNIEVEMEAIDFEERVTPEVETALYRIVQEALTNVARHAQANRVSIRLERKESTVVAFIEDDGQGFDVEKITGPQVPERGAGLLGIRERVSSLGGTLSIQSRPGQGTRLTIEIPA